MVSDHHGVEGMAEKNISHHGGHEGRWGEKERMPGLVGFFFFSLLSIWTTVYGWCHPHSGQVFLS
jgi:hypothetical protein